MPLDVCFVALHALPVICPQPGRPVGGTETRAWTFARDLARSDQARVQFVVRGDRGDQAFEQDRVRVLPRQDRLYSLYEAVGHCVEKSPRPPWLRLRRWNWHLVWQLPLLAALRLAPGPKREPRPPDPFYQQIEADVFCTFGVQSNSARVLASAHSVGKPVVLVIGSDGDLDERYRPGSDYVSPYGDAAALCYDILRQADRIVVQTAHQQRLLRDRFGREGTVIANPFDLAAWQARATQDATEFVGGLDRYALWIGRAEKVHKRPQLLLELARRCPQVPFLMILNRRDPTIERQIHSERPDNVQILPAVPVDLMPAIFSKAAVLVSTSSLEGFPNVFLQAAASGVPIASLEVGKEFLADAHAGEFACGDLDRLADFVKRCREHPWPPDQALQYVATHHDVRRQSDRLRQVLEQATDRLSPHEQ